LDETIPQEDVLVLGKLGAAKRVQKDVATSKCTLKAYLAQYMRWYDTGVYRDAGIWDFRADDGQGDMEGLTNDGKTPETAYKDANEYHSGSTPASFDGVMDGTVPDSTVDASIDIQKHVAGTGPWPGITMKGFLAGENWTENGIDAHASQGLLEQLIFESLGGYESRIEVFQPSTPAGGLDKLDGFTFFGIMSSVTLTPQRVPTQP
jgi:hypothetical protein